MTPEQIARGLTKAQRNALLYSLRCYADPNTIRALRRRGLYKAGLITDLGLAVRAELERIADE